MRFLNGFKICRQFQSLHIFQYDAVKHFNFHIPNLFKVDSSGFHFSTHLNAKSFQEKENEYAHRVMESIPAYFEYVLKPPLGIEGRSQLPNELKKFEKKLEQGDPKNEDLVFVYGTLKINEPNYDQLTNPSLGKATHVGLGRTVQKWPLVIASRFNIPFLLHKEGLGKNIIGEVFRVDKTMLSHMDEFESHPTYYTRMLAEVELVNNVSMPSIVTPWVYFLKKFRPKLLELPFLENYTSNGPHGLEYITSDDITDPDDI